MNKNKTNIKENKEISPEDTYPKHFFDLFGGALGLGLKEPKDLPPEDDDFNLE